MMERLGQLIRYGGTAGTAAVVDLAGFAMLERTELNVAPAAALSFLIATVVNYGLTARFVFRSPTSIRGYWRFLAAAAAGFGMNVGITVLAIWYFDMHPVPAKTLGIGLAFFANFLLNLLFVFRPKDADGSGERRLP